MESGDTFQVVQVLATEPSTDAYLMGRRRLDETWEYPGGKIKEDEDILDAAVRELNEELKLGIERNDIREHRKGESYRSENDERFRLNPVEIEFEENSLTLPDAEFPDHDSFEWVRPNEFYKYETLGQYQALETTGIVNGDVALAVARNQDRYLLLKRSEHASSTGRWTFPGGKVENESFAEAAHRELDEETALDGEIIREGDFYINEGELGYWRVKPFLMDVEGDVELSKEHTDHEWIRRQDIHDYKTVGEVKAYEKLRL